MERLTRVLPVVICCINPEEQLFNICNIIVQFKSGWKYLVWIFGLKPAESTTFFANPYKCNLLRGILSKLQMSANYFA